MSDSLEDLKQRLTSDQYHIACEGGTEPPFNNKYWDHKEEGVYVDVISGKPLFLSDAKFDSGTGWPSFSAPADPDEIVEIEDNSYGMRR
ncbi:MAG: peptide-methionine (R)-S-oxide reductase, partial [Verrucomicrobiota bacterium]